MKQDEVKKGAPVYLDTHPSQLGVLTGKTMELGDLLMAQVNWGANAEYQDIEHLVVKNLDAADDIETVVGKAAYGTITDLRRRMTYEKLQGTLSDVFYSMAAAQIDFLPHQFKPVLRFIDSPTNRLLIADEVGLGKTIEGGLIWLECQARYGARRLLVVCPATLCLKWRRELRERFQLDVSIADANRLLDLMNEFDRIGDKLTFQVICSYHALRPPKDDLPLLAPLYGDRPDMADIDESKLSKRGRLLKRMADRGDGHTFADLALFDEAAVLKNTATASHALGRIVSSESGGCVCLSATPIHNTSRDLFALLRIVDPDYFNTEFSFDILRRNNHPVVRLLNALSRPPLQRGPVMEAVQALGSSEYLQASSILEQIKERVDHWDGTPAGAVQVFQMAEKLNLLSGFICRTRKMQISVEGRVQRRSATVPVTYTDEEMQFYRAVLRHIRRQVRLKGMRVTSFHTMGPALRMSSCLPVMADLLRDGKWGGIDELVAAAEETGEYEIEGESDELDAEALQKSLRWIHDYDFESNDTKYTIFKAELLGNLKQEKVIVFAFFKDTLRYLARRLSQDGISAMMLTGDITDQSEREQIIQNFERNDARVLLCSEVAAEGIDLQFCRTVVNYDLPWNPMRVEQRIGRVDRIGQLAKAINIVNFCINGTIDGLIYAHLYEKIGIFQNTIGDLETIIGPEISRLTSALLCDDLTEEEEIRLIEQTQMALESRRQSESELEKTGNDFMAYADYLAEQIGASRRLGRYVKPSELRLYLSDFFAQEFAGCRLDWDTPTRDCGRLNLSYEAADSLNMFIRLKTLPIPPGFAAGGRSLSFTLDPEVYKRIHRQHRDVALINHLHPLVRWVTQSIRDKADKLYKVAAARIATASLRPGRYFFLVRRLTLKGLHRREHLFYAMKEMATGDLVEGDAIESLLNETLERGESLFPGQVGGMDETLNELQTILADACDSTLKAYKDEMDAKRLVQAGQAKAHFGRKIEITERQIAGMRASGGDKKKGLALSEARLESLRKGLESKVAKLNASASVGVTADNVVCGLLEVVRP